ncbi:MAG: hypothetical protein J2P32_18830, partial [Actinobacteria bacterium]|nr:hypothetical protein [Actinomycetota bacterium]
MSAVPPEPPQASSEQSADRSGTAGQQPSPPADFGPNEWLVDELYQRYLADPGSVDMAWWNFFADYQAGAQQPPGAPARQAPRAAGQQAPQAAGQQAPQ